MLGLVWIDWLSLTPGQWVAVGCHTVGWLWWFRASRGRSLSGSLRQHLVIAGLLFSGLWVAFWHATTCIDTWLLFDQAQELAPLPWQAFREQVWRHLYVKHQPPFVTFWFARLPILWAQQLIWFPWALLCAGLMRQLYGRHASLLMATPVFSLLIHQPCHDTLLFGMLLIVLRLVQLSGVQRRRGVLSGILSVSKGLSKGCTPWRVLAAFVYGLTWTIKPLTILTAPFILPQLGMAGFLSLTMWGGYVCWSLQWEFGRQQFSFLLQQLLLRSMKSSGKGTGAPQASLTLAARWWKRLNTIRNALTWRWEHLGSKAVTALPFYLFPAYLRPWMWQGIALAVIIVLGYGNIKYLLLDLLFVFPVRREENLM